MEAPIFEIPDYFLPAVGFRVNRLYLDPVSFVSPYYSWCKWPTEGPNRTVKAICGWGGHKMIPTHVPPAPQGVHPSHPCGIYAHYFTKHLKGNDTPKLLYKHTGECHGAMVLTIVEGWGNVEAHEHDEDGFRSQYARIAALCRPVETLKSRGRQTVIEALEAITDALEVPLLDRDAAEDFASEIGVNLAPSMR